MKMRNAQSVIIWIVMIAWVVFTIFAVEKLGVDSYQAVGLGAVTGVFLKMLSDMWQFYFRKKSEGG